MKIFIKLPIQTVALTNDFPTRIRDVHVLRSRLILCVIRNMGDVTFPDSLLAVTSEVLFGAISQVLWLCTSSDDFR